MLTWEILTVTALTETAESPHKSHQTQLFIDNVSNVSYEEDDATTILKNNVTNLSIGHYCFYFDSPWNVMKHNMSLYLLHYVR